jgi:hypothetical protein
MNNDSKSSAAATTTSSSVTPASPTTATAAPTKLESKEYKKQFDSDGFWLLDEFDVEALALGCTVLGCGGGGNVMLGRLRAISQLQRGSKVRRRRVITIIKNINISFLLLFLKKDSSRDMQTGVPTQRRAFVATCVRFYK